MDQDHGPSTLDQDQGPTNTCRADARRGEVDQKIDEVFSCYEKHHPRSKLTEDRRKMIRARLKEGYSVEDLCKAIDGLHLSPHHRGENDRGTVYLDIQYAMRDGRSVARCMALYERPPTATSSVSLFNERASDEFLEALDAMEG